MKQDMTEIVVLLNKQGDTSKIIDDTINGYNRFIDEQKKLPGEAVLTTIFFDHSNQLIHDRVDIKQAKNVTRKNYMGGKRAALCETIINAINDVGTKLDQVQENDKPAKVVFAIFTDGPDNASINNPIDKVKKMVTQQRNTYNWEFLFFAANIDAGHYGGSLGLVRTCNYGEENIADAINHASRAIGNYRKTGSVE
jgi:hypothetical protein